MSDSFDVAVVGGGLAGSMAALALGRKGLKVVFVAPRAPAIDGRTTALLMPSIRELEALGLWGRLQPLAAPLRTMRIVDDTRRLLRAPEAAFNAGELGEPAFGYNIPNSDLLAALEAMIGECGTVTRFESPLERIDAKADPVRLTLADGSALTAALVVAADGRNSLCRQAAGISCKQWQYPQTAFVLTFRHSLPHSGVSTEFHTPSGPFTQVPLAGDRSSLVWVVAPGDVEKIKNLSGDALNRSVEDGLHSILGKVEVDSPLQSFPLSGLAAERMAEGPVVLIGEAAHAFPPIGAQGLNLGLRDVAALVRQPLRLDSRRAVEDAAARYDRARRIDVKSRIAAVDALNRSLLSAFLPVQFARAAGISLLSMPGPLRDIALREGMKPGSSLTSLPGRLREKFRRRSAANQHQEDQRHRHD